MATLSAEERLENLIVMEVGIVVLREARRLLMTGASNRCEHCCLRSPWHDGTHTVHRPPGVGLKYPCKANRWRSARAALPDPDAESSKGEEV